MRKVVHKLAKLLAILLCLLAIALFFDWLVFNILLGCCAGGECWPDIYPQCHNENYKGESNVD